MEKTMMSMNNLRCLFSVTLCLTLAARPVLASNDLKIADSFKTQAIQQVKDGEITEGLHNFARALLLNPNDKFIQDKFSDLSGSSRLTPQQHIELTLLTDLIEYSQQLKSRIGRIEDIRNSIGRDLIERGANVQDLELEMNNIKDNVVSDERIADLESQMQAINKEDNPLKVLIATYNFEIEHLSDKLIYLDRQYERLEQIARQQDMDSDGANEVVRLDNVYDETQGVSIADLAMMQDAGDAEDDWDAQVSSDNQEPTASTTQPLPPESPLEGMPEPQTRVDDSATLSNKFSVNRPCGAAYVPRKGIKPQRAASRLLRRFSSSF
jgi:hypothetical protein